MRASSAAIQFPQLSPLPAGSFSFTTRVELLKGFAYYIGQRKILASCGEQDTTHPAVDVAIFQWSNNTAIRSFRTRICFAQQLFFFSVKSESRVDGLHNLRVVPSATLTAEKEETVVPEAAFTVEKEAVKNVLTLFLRKQGLTNAAAIRTISKSDRFINHLVSRLHTIDKTRYLVGSELPILALEIRDALVPYLESLHKEHGDILVDVLGSFPNPPDNKGPIFQACPTNLPLDSKKLKGVGPVNELHLSGKLPPPTPNLLDIGIGLDQINEIIRKYPPFVNYTLEENIKPVVKFLLDLGMPQSDIPSFIFSAPYCCGTNLSETTIPTLLYLENLGVDKGDWVKILKKSPVMFKCTKRKVKRTVDFLHEIGFSTKDVANVITRRPGIISYSVDNKLRPTAEYFCSMGINVPYLLYHSQRVFGSSLEQKIKPVTEFWLDKGYSTDEIGTMAVKFRDFYQINLKENIIPKWDFFLTMDYPRSELVNFPCYFGYSLEGRIKPRYEQMMESDVKWGLRYMLVPTDPIFKRTLSKRMEKKLRYGFEPDVDSLGSSRNDVKTVTTADQMGNITTTCLREL